MEINAQSVIDKLSIKVANMTRDLVIAEAQIEALRSENEKLHQLIPRDTEIKEQSIEGEAIG